MSERNWPEPIQQVRSVLPAEMRILRGVLGLLAGGFLLLSVLNLLLAGNWHLGFGDSRVLVSIYFLLVPAALGILSPLWYWLGRPLWIRANLVDEGLIQTRGRPGFLPGLLGAVVGIALLFPVDATVSFWIQTLAPFGLAVAIASPVWFWLGRPVVGTDVHSMLPPSLADTDTSRIGRRVIVGLAVLFVASAVLTSVIGLPIVGLSETVQTQDLEISISDARVVDELTDASGETRGGTYDWKLLLINVTVENNGDQVHRLPGASVTEISTISPICSAQTFGEPQNNCNEMYLTGNFSAGGMTYTNYDDHQAMLGGELGPNERVSGWLVFRLESRPTEGSTLQAMVIVDDVGRWKFQTDFSGEDF